MCGQLDRRFARLAVVGADNVVEGEVVQIEERFGGLAVVVGANREFEPLTTKNGRKNVESPPYRPI